MHEDNTEAAEPQGPNSRLRPLSSSLSDALTRVLTSIQDKTVVFIGPNSLDSPTPAAGGSGVLLDIAGQGFILTAAHHVKSWADHGIPIWAGGMHAAMKAVELRGSQIMTFKNTEALDIAVVRLPDTVDLTLRRTMSYARLTDFAIGEVPTEKSMYGIVGFPETGFALDENTQSFNLTAFPYLTSAYVGAEGWPDGYNQKVDRAFEFIPNEGLLPSGASVTLPALPGVSGAGIWTVIDVHTKEPSFDSKLIAIEHGWYPKRNIFVGTKIEYALLLIDSQLPDFHKSIEVHFDVSWSSQLLVQGIDVNVIR